MVILFSTNTLRANESEPDKSVRFQINEALETLETLDLSTSNLDEELIALESDLSNSIKKQSSLNDNIQRSYKLQKEIQTTSLRLISILENKDKEIRPIGIELIQPTNWYIFALPLVTIVIVIGGTFLSLRTISIKSKESITALDISNKNQFDINESNIKAEKKRSHEAIISNNRQKWINTLRDDISLLLSTLSRLAMVMENPEGQADKQTKLTDDFWLEYYKIQLLLNPKEEDHQELSEQIKNILEAIGTKTDFNEPRDQVLSLSKSILKREWERVKSFE